MSNWRNINKTFLYDGSFYGLLTVIYECYMSKIVPVNILDVNNYEINIFDIYEFIKTDLDKANKLYNAIYTNISYDTLYNAYNAFLSVEKDKEINILKYILLGFKVKSKVNNMLSIDYVFKVYSLRKNVLMEAHRLKGLLRFVQLNEKLYYASIHPDNNVIENIGNHFINRLPNENFVIHDKNRDIAFIYNTKTYMITELKNLKLPPLSDTEKMYQTLWRSFFNTISIKERSNPRLQMQYMPKKYWKDLIENP